MPNSSFLIFDFTSPSVFFLFYYSIIFLPTTLSSHVNEQSFYHNAETKRYER